MAITYVSSSKDAQASNSFAVNVPAGIADDDVMFAVVATILSSANIATPAGWTLLHTYQESGGTDQSVALLQRVASSEPVNYTFSHSGGATNRTSVTINAWRGLNTSTPLDVARVPTPSVNNNNPTPGPITTVTDNCVVVVRSAITQANITEVFAPTGYTLRSQIIQPDDPQADDVNQMSASIITTTAGLVTPTAWNNTDDGTNLAESISYTLALRPAPTAPAPIISGVSGNDAEGTVTITVDSYDTVSGITYGGIALADIIEDTATTLTATMPATGLAYESSNDFIVTDTNGASNTFAALYNVPVGMLLQTLTVAYAGLPVESIIFGNLDFVNLAIGDQFAYEAPVDGPYILALTSESVATFDGLAPIGTYIVSVRVNDISDSNTITAGIFNVVALASPPEQITDLVLTPGIELLNFAWSAPTTNSPIIRNDLQFKVSAGGPWITWVDSVLSTAVTINDISGNTYDGRVRAVSTEGPGLWSNVEINTVVPAISVSLELELNNEGLIDSPIGINNTGVGVNRDFLNQVGGGAALSLESHRSKKCYQSSGDRALQTAGTQATISQPATFFWVGIPFFVDGFNYRVIWSSPGGSPDASARTGETTLFAGGAAVNGPPISTDGTEWIIVWHLDGANSSVRCIKNDGSTDNTVNGSTGSDNPSPFILGWDPSLSANRQFNAQSFEFDWFTGTLSANEISSKVNALKQNWFTGFNAPLPLPEILLDEAGVTAIGWTNTGTTAGANDFDTVSGVGGNLTVGSIAGLATLNSTGDAKLTSSNAVAITGPYTVYAVFTLSSVAASIKYLFSSGLSFNISTSGHAANAGVLLSNAVSGSTDLAVITVVVNGVNGRLSGVGGAAFNSAGDAGSNSFLADSLLWNMSSTAGESFLGDFCEFHVYANAHSTELRGQIQQGLLAKWTPAAFPIVGDPRQNNRLALNIGISI